MLREELRMLSQEESLAEAKLDKFAAPASERSDPDSQPISSSLMLDVLLMAVEEEQRYEWN